MKKLVLFIGLLGLSSATMANLPESCNIYFNKLDNLVKLIPKNEASEQQINMLKQRIELQKKQASQLPIEQLNASCKKGLELYKQMESLMLKK